MAGIKTIQKNKKAYFEYFIKETFEAGIELTGTEVKSIRAGSISLKEAWCEIKDGEIFIKQMHIAPYEKGNIFNRDPLRTRKLLMHKKQIAYLFAKMRQDGLTVVPTKIYFSRSYVKLEVGLAQGKKLHDKRHVAAEKDAKRSMNRAIKEQGQG